MYTIVAYRGFVIEVEADTMIGYNASIKKDDLLLMQHKGYMTAEQSVIDSKECIDKLLLIRGYEDV